ncbi:unnamed protein product [Rotaria socialis]|nr:unnamed protein product [Rotaria socialis]CAF3430644.1 unnamed protein product [Rotaria socialis]CAF4343076.1 unnamed protein product [Rotaria socialis]CAF4494204.1 unnamed protein product [Rotaria socialis]CAF4545544.1 unnamed protein product [Rotaria socialis]
MSHVVIFTQCELAPCPIQWRLPCPLPPWSPTYNMQLSTQHYFYSSEGYYDNQTVFFAALHGVVGIDWANHYGLPMHREDTLAQQAAYIKNMNPKTRVFVYRQSELALNIFDNGAKVMYDTTKKTDWFVLYPNGTIYNDSTIVGNYRMDQFCWDHRNPEVQDYFVNYYVGSAFNQSVVDGIFYDDDGGIWDERINHPNYTEAYREAVDAAQQVSLNRAWELGLKYKKHAWQAWLSPSIPSRKDTPAACASKMKTAISMKNVPVTFPAMYNGACDHPWEQCEDLEQQLAAFLIARGDYWLFFTPNSWWKEGFEADYGVPLDDAYELFPNVFVRQWSNCTIYLDCNNFLSEIIFRSSTKSVDRRKLSSYYFVALKYFYSFYYRICRFCRIFSF